jgi:hypothetical protein
MCQQHDDNYIDLRTGRCIICSSRHCVPRLVAPKKSSQETQETVQRSDHANTHDGP